MKKSLAELVMDEGKIQDSEDFLKAHKEGALLSIKGIGKKKICRSSKSCDDPGNSYY